MNFFVVGKVCAHITCYRDIDALDKTFLFCFCSIELNRIVNEIESELCIEKETNRR